MSESEVAPSSSALALVCADELTALAEQWERARAESLYDALDRLAESAEANDSRPVADSALELVVYLSSFVESDSPPGAAQAERMGSLALRLRTIAGGAPAQARPQARAAEDHRPSVVCVGLGQGDCQRLGHNLARSDLAVRGFARAEDAIAAVAALKVVALVVADDLIPQLPSILEAVERAHPERAGVPALALVPDGNSARTRFARRSGAEAVAAIDDAAAAASALADLLDAEARRAVRVLVVEDERQQSMLCESILRHAGVSARVAASGEEALAALAEFVPDLILLDLYLPDMNGIELTQILRERPDLADVPIVFLSGEHSPQVRFDAIRMGGDDFLLKPVKPRHLIAAVTGRVRRARRARGEPGSTRIGEGDAALLGADSFLALLTHPPGDLPAHVALAMVGLADDEGARLRLGLAASETLARDFARALSELPALGRRVARFGDYSALVVLASDDARALTDQAEAVLAALERTGAGARWLLAGQRIELPLATPDVAIVGVREAWRRAAADGLSRIALDVGVHADDAHHEDPRLRLTRSLLTSKLLEKSARFGYAPMQPLAATVSGHFAVGVELVPPRSRQTAPVQRAEYLPIALSLRRVRHLERWTIRQVLGAIARRGSKGDELFLHVPLTLASVVDEAFAPWLATELRAHRVAASRLVLELGAAEVAPALDAARAAVETVQQVGVRLGVVGLVGGEPRALITNPAFTWLGCDVAALADATVGRALADARAHGKLTHVAGVAAADQVAECLRLGVEYISGDFLSAPLAVPEYDFATDAL